MSNHRILLLKTPEEDEIHIDGITFTNREFLEEIINMLNKCNFEDVITKISNFLDENPHYKTIDYYHFANPLEELMFSENLKI